MDKHLCSATKDASDAALSGDLAGCAYCPRRVLCDGQPCLPVGNSDLPGVSTVKIFCPKCEDIYYPRIDYQVRRTH
jgi:hypothetical protein